MKTLYDLYRKLKKLGVLRYVFVVAGAILTILKVVENIMRKRKAVHDANDTTGRDVPIGVPDKNGQKQVPVRSGRKNETAPDKVEPLERTEVTASGTLDKKEHEVTSEDLMRKLGLLMIFLLLPVFVYADTVTIDKALYNEMKAAVKRLYEIETGTPAITMGKIIIHKDQQGRVFVNDSVEVSMKLRHLKFSGMIKTNANSFILGLPKQRMISKFGLYSVVEPDDNAPSLRLNTQVLYLGFTLFQYNKLGLDVVSNFRRLGIGPTFALTPNTRLIVGATFRYGKDMRKTGQPFVGVGFKF